MNNEYLTLKWSRPSALPLVVKGVHMDPNSEKYFPNEFGGEMRATDKVIQKNQNTATKSKIGCTFTKWRPKKKKKTISFLRHNISDQKWKTTFPKEFFLEILLIIEDC